jgi:hypothetical protein
MKPVYASWRHLHALYHQPGLDPRLDPRLQVLGLAPEDLDLAAEEMLCELGLDPNKIGNEPYLAARLLWLRGRIARNAIPDHARRFRGIEDRHARAIAIFAVVKEG